MICTVVNCPVINLYGGELSDSDLYGGELSGDDLYGGELSDGDLYGGELSALRADDDELMLNVL